MMKRLPRIVLHASLALITGCSDYATFVTSTSIGVSANVDTQQAQIGFTRAELFQGPAYPGVGDAPPAVGFLGSDLAPVSPHVRQLYATGEAAAFVTNPDPPANCPTNGQAAPGQFTRCPEAVQILNGERRPMVFGTGVNVGLKLGFTGNTPSKINFGYDREELSIIPLHKQAPAAGSATQPSDKYSSVLASLDLNTSVTSQLGSGLQMTQFFATGAAARNLAKRDDIRGYFQAAASKAVLTGDYAPDKSSACIRVWRGSPPDVGKTGTIVAKANSLNTDIGNFLDLPGFAADRQAFVTANKILCQ